MMIKKYLSCSLICLIIAVISIVIFSRCGNFSSAPVRSEKQRKAFTSNFPNLAAALTDSIIIPGLNSAYVPQGLTIDHDNQTVIISYYFKGIGPKKPSIIAVVDLNNSRAVTTYKLYDTQGEKYTGHAGALTITDNHLWTCSDGRVLRFKYPPQNNNQTALLADTSYNVDSNADFLTIHKDRLWVGDFDNGDDFTTPTHHHQYGKTAWIASYKINPDTDSIIQDQTYTINNTIVLKPDTVMLIEQKVQGMAFCGDTVALSISYSHTDSTLKLYQMPTESKDINLPDGTILKSHTLDSSLLINSFTLPAGAEDISCSNNQLAIIFESASKHYRYKWRLHDSRIEDRILIIQMNKTGFIR